MYKQDKPIRRGFGRLSTENIFKFLYLLLREKK